MIANGMEELSSRDELSAAVGFPVKAAMSLPFFPQEIHYTSYWGDMAQTDYANGSAGACLPPVRRRGRIIPATGTNTPRSRRSPPPAAPSR